MFRATSRLYASNKVTPSLCSSLSVYLSVHFYTSGLVERIFMIFDFGEVSARWLNHLTIVFTTGTLHEDVRASACVRSVCHFLAGTKTYFEQELWRRTKHIFYAQYNAHNSYGFEISKGKRCCIDP